MTVFHQLWDILTALANHAVKKMSITVTGLKILKLNSFAAILKIFLNLLMFPFNFTVIRR